MLYLLLSFFGLCWYKINWGFRFDGLDSIEHWDFEVVKELIFQAYEELVYRSYQFDYFVKEGFLPNTIFVIGFMVIYKLALKMVRNIFHMVNLLIKNGIDCILDL